MADRMPVGQVWIRVSPDTRGFARETKERLRTMKSLDKHKVPIEVEVDAEQIEKDFGQAIKNLQKKAEQSDYKVKIQTELDWKASSARRDIRRQYDRYQALADERKIEFKTNLDPDKAGTADYTPTVTLDVDERGFERDVQRLMEQTKAKLKVDVDKKSIRQEVTEAAEEISGFLDKVMSLDKNKVKLELEVDNLRDAELWHMELRKYYDDAADSMKSARRELDRTSKEYRQIARQIAATKREMKGMTVNTSEGAEEYRQLTSRLGKLNQQLRVYGAERKRLMDFGRRNYLTIETNMESMREAEDRVNALRERVNEIASEIEVGLDHSSMARASAELFALARPRVISIYTNIVNTARWQKFWARANESAASMTNSLMTYTSQLIGLRLLYRTATDILRIIPRLDMMIPALAAGSVAAVSAISAASTLLGSIFSIAGDMMKMFNLALMLPSILAGLTGTVLILGRALKDFKSRFPEIISYWEELGNTVSDRVWKQAADNVRNLHKALVPILNANVPDWASAWGDSMGAFADGLRKAVGTGHLDEFLKNSIKGTKAAERGWEALGSALLRMVGIGSRFFPDMGNWFSDTMESFEDWIKKNDANGNFERWVRDGIRAFKDFGRVIRATGSILRSLSIAAKAAGLPGLTEFADGMTALAEKMRSPSFQDALVGPLENMVGMMGKLRTLAPLLSESLGTLWQLAGHAALTLGGPLVGAIEAVLTSFNSGKFQSDMMTFFEGIGSFIEDITPGLGVLVLEFGRMARVVGIAAREWGPAFNELILMLEDFGGGLHLGMESFLEATGPALLELIRDLRPAVKDFGDALGDLLSDKAFQEFVTYVLDALGNIAELALRAGTVLLGAFKGFANWWAQQPEWFKELSSHLIAIAVAAPLVAVGFKMIARALTPFIWVATKLRTALLLLGGALGWVGKRLIAWGARGGLGGIIARVLGRSLLIGTGPVGWALLIASIVPYDLSVTIANAVIQAVFPDGWFKEMATRITDEVNRQVAGRTIFGIIWDSIKQIFDKDSSWQERIWASIVAIFPPAFLIKALGEGLARWILDDLKFESVRDTLYRLMTTWTLYRIAEIISTLNETWDAFKQKIEDWEPTGFVTSAVKWFHQKFVEPIIDWILSGFGGGGGGDGSGADFFGANSDFGSNLWSTKFEPWLRENWTRLTDSIKGWRPYQVAIEFLKNPIKTILKWLGINNGWPAGGGIGAGVALVNWGGRLWNEYFLPKLREGWTRLTDALMRWKPFRAAIEFIQHPVKTVMKWLGINDGWPAGGGINIGVGLVNWGSKLWDNSLKPWLEDGWSTVEGKMNAWTPGGGGGSEGKGSVKGPSFLVDWIKKNFLGDDPGGQAEQGIRSAFDGIIPRISNEMAAGRDRLRTALRAAQAGEGTLTETLGLGPTGQREAATGAQLLGGTVARFIGRVTGDYGVMGTTVSGTTMSMYDNTSRDFGGMESKAKSSTDGMKRTTSGNFNSMESTATSKSSGMRSSVSDQLGKMAAVGIAKVGQLQAQSAAKMGAMQIAVISKMSAMSAQSGAKMVQMQGVVLRALTALQAGAVARGRAMGTAYVAQMASLVARAISTVGRLRSILPGILSINASGPGRMVGATFTSGLSSGLSRARSVAYSIRNGIRSALSFSAYGSGSTVGGTFASGLRARVGAVSAAARALAAAARTKLPNSPAKEGPFAGSGWGGWGESIADELVEGLRRGAPEVAAEATRMMERVHSALDTRASADVGLDIARQRALRDRVDSISPAPVAGVGTVNVNVESRSDEPFEEAVRFARDLQFALEGVRL